MSSEINVITEQIIGAAIEVHRNIGPGMLESTYEQCLVFELAARGLRFERQRHLPLIYKGQTLGYGYRVDLIVEERVIVEIKAVDRLEPVHSAQVLSYLRWSGCPVGLLFNFNVKWLMDRGFERLALGLSE